MRGDIVRGQWWGMFLVHLYIFFSSGLGGDGGLGSRGNWAGRSRVRRELGEDFMVHGTCAMRPNLWVKCTPLCRVKIYLNSPCSLVWTGYGMVPTIIGFWGNVLTCLYPEMERRTKST